MFNGKQKGLVAQTANKVIKNKRVIDSRCFAMSAPKSAVPVSLSR
jgi:hypothetical protein